MRRLIRGPIRLERSLSRNIRIFCALQVVTGFFIRAPVWILCLTESRGLPLGEVATMEPALSVAVIAGEVPTGPVADSWERRMSLALGWFRYGGAGIPLSLLWAHANRNAVS